MYPVIASHCDKYGYAFPGERRIAMLSGRSEKVVRRGIQALSDFPGFRCNYYTTRRGKKSKKFHIAFPRKNENDRAFPFYKCIIDEHFWTNLLPCAIALYPVMRCFGFFDIDYIEECSDMEVNEIDYKEIYKNRYFDICEANHSELACYAGINSRSMPNALKVLQQNNLIEPIDGGDKWKVYLKPQKFFRYESLSHEALHSNPKNGTMKKVCNIM